MRYSRGGGQCNGRNGSIGKDFGLSPFALILLSIFCTHFKYCVKKQVILSRWNGNSSTISARFLCDCFQMLSAEWHGFVGLVYIFL